jgi:hypothetical protein
MEKINIYPCRENRFEKEMALTEQLKLLDSNKALIKNIKRFLYFS